MCAATLALGTPVAAAQDAGPPEVACPVYESQALAQAALRENPTDPFGVDGPPGPNNDTTGTRGIACEQLACPCDRTPVIYDPSVPLPTVPPGPGAVVGSTSPGGTAPGGPTASIAGTGNETATRPIERDGEGGLRRWLWFAPAGLIVVAYGLWLRRDRRLTRQLAPRAQYPTEW